MASSSRDLDPRRLDVAAFSAAGAELAGDWRADRLPRLLAATLAPDDGTPRPGVTWRASGERRGLVGAGTQPSLAIEAETDVTLECQRCLQPMRVPLRATRRIFFVDGEDEAAALDADSEDDVLALAPALDLAELIEDELLLALPLVPRHEHCPVPLPRALVEDSPPNDPADNPFAVLAALKRGPRPN
ncbi:MAG: YceD family protein [Caldimonas sp.]